MSQTKEVNAKQKAAKKIGPWQIVMLFLCVYVLIALFIDTAFDLPVEIHELLNKIDFYVCILFLLDFFTNLYRAENKLKYLKWGWIDFISSIPMLEAFRWGRVARVFRILRLLRGVRSTKHLLSFLFKNRAEGTLASMILISLVLVIFSSILILNVETGEDATIKNASDALWWSCMTVTTVGYGNLHPVSDLGRVLGVLLMMSRIAILGTFTAYIVTVFFEKAEREDKRRDEEILEKLIEIQARLDKLE